ncbi:uncharacterized protein L3040_003116 [Drepanopeziza brunnea f. sp. 'multigermtubi']|uniref:RNA polymerase II degradation factor 1 n=1 Tax=Marssonina brunnea f. sp. multigermtubi (strain MB_m1) TaxID=1072389 RepID=K1XTC1_MARBU|nr:rnapii degradation factor def1 [Drepanopeziza brunnea f. sp. 'multigermtubi' MB_m1]EKD15759.1 rnapii degradation factor def1 [Drepanopeziza brunnea f. sp. 'multigermtubi' MB_m1]KAJ5047283.1 hypothetical protein L3040_003116 [Drepanopeziza brunnea f. sp. 'multigermtubi']
MSEVQSRPAAPRGRGSARGGRGGFSTRGRGGARSHAINGDKTDSAPASIEDDGEVGQLKKKYGSKVTTIQEMFPDWTDEDIVFALQETDGDLETTVDRITDGTITQWGEVSKNKKDRSKSKVKEVATITSFGDIASQTRVARGGRAGFDGTRGGRGRATERGGRGGRVRAPTNGARKENIGEASLTTEAPAWETVPAAESSWDTPKATEGSWDTTKPAIEESWGSTAAEAVSATAAVAAKATSSVIPEGVKKSWASIFAPPPVPKKAPEPVVEKPAELTKVQAPVEAPVPEPKVSIPEPAAVEAVETPPVQEVATPEPEVQITPSKDELTEDNLEQLPDVSAPAPTATAASTAASSWDPRSAAATPFSNLQSQPQAIRPPTSGFQASALKATGASGRTPSYQRRVLDQEEAVRMPGNREVDRTAVQFGAFNLNGSGDEDVDGDREEAETRAQPPQHSPVAPRAALPPVLAQAAPVPESLPTAKQSSGLPAATHPTAAPGLPSPAPLSSAQATSQQGPQGNGQYSAYGRYGPAGTQESSLPPKPYDAFSQQAPSSQSPFEGYPSQQSQSQPQSGAFTSAPNEFSSYYTADPQQQRNAYNSYYNHQQYGAQQGSQAQDGPASQQRGYPGYNGPQAENSSQFPQSAAQGTQSRYATAGEGQNSGHSTPNPIAQSQHPAASQGSQPQPGHQQQPQAGNYPYNHPYYQSPYYAAWNQYQQYGGGNYPGAPYGAKAGHQQPYQGYGMSPNAPYEHTASPAAGGFGASSLHGRESALGGLSDYGRAGSAQAAPTPQALGGGGAFGGHDAFGRGSSYQGQGQQHYNGQQGAQPGTGDDLKPFGDSKTANGPSPSLSQAGRPGSATNTTSGSALPQTQNPTGYGGYPAHLQQPGQGLHANQTGSGYGGLGGTGHQAGGQGHQNSQYGAYQGFGGNNYYGNSQQRGGWGGNYGH